MYPSSTQVADCPPGRERGFIVFELSPDGDQRMCPQSTTKGKLTAMGSARDLLSTDTMELVIGLEATRSRRKALLRILADVTNEIDGHEEVIVQPNAAAAGPLTPGTRVAGLFRSPGAYKSRSVVR
ncbi:hypothetical protein HK405_010424, partial [Cladochytrium tenue]